MIIKWLGHSCFKISCDGESVVIDPFQPGSVRGLRDINEEAQMVLCSHMHGDHNYTGGVKLIESKNNVFTVETLNTYHDDKKGKLRGENLVHIITTLGYKVVHMGDLGCDLTDQQYALLNDVDVLMIPVGSVYTIDGKKAAAIAKRINPKVIVPMHYSDEKFDYDVLDNVFKFTQYFDNVIYLTTDTLEFSDELENEVIVFDYPNPVV